MKTINIVRLTEDEKNELVLAGKDEDPVKVSKIIKENDNQTLSILRALKNVHKWNDIEDMVNYVEILKLFDTDQESIDLNDDQLKLVKKVFSETAKSEKLSGQGLEQIVNVYSTFK